MIKRSILTIFLMSAICSCTLQVRPIGGVSEEELEATAKSVERAFQILDARLKKLEGQDEASK